MRVHAISFAERIGFPSQRPVGYLFDSFFLWNKKNDLIAHFRIANHYDTPKSYKSFPVGTIMRRRNDENWYKTKIGVGTSVTVNVRERYEKIREVKIIRMIKELVSWM